MPVAIRSQSRSAIAVAMVKGPQAGLDLLGTLDADARLAET
jgi:predicted RNA polymerase sigma factor